MQPLIRLALVLLTLAAGALARTPPAMAGAVPVSAEAAARLINAHRRAHGRARLVVDPRLGQAAALHARDMAAHNRLSHSVAHGNVYARVVALGARPRLVAENVSGGRRTLAAVIRGWIASPGHNRNLLLARASRMGIAAVFEPDTRYGYYWALILAGD